MTIYIVNEVGLALCEPASNLLVVFQAVCRECRIRAAAGRLKPA